MERKRGAGSPLLLAALLLLTGLHVKAEQSTESPQSTQVTSLASKYVPTETAVSREDTTTVTPSGTVSTTVQTNEPESKASTEPLGENTVSVNDTVSVTTTTKVSITSKNNSSDSTPTATSSTTIGVSTNPHSTTPIDITSISTASEPSTPYSTGHTSGPTEFSTGTVTTANETQTGSTNQMGNTGSIVNTTKSVNSSSEPVTEKTSQSSGTESSPTPSVPELTPASKTQTTASKTDATTEHNVELSKALSPGSVAAITIIVIALVLLIFGGAAYWKIRHSSYGRLLEDQDYGSLGNYNNPLYDDS